MAFCSVLNPTTVFSRYKKSPCSDLVVPHVAYSQLVNTTTNQRAHRTVARPKATVLCTYIGRPNAKCWRYCHIKQF